MLSRNILGSFDVQERDLPPRVPDDENATVGNKRQRVPSAEKRVLRRDIRTNIGANEGENENIHLFEMVPKVEWAKQQRIIEEQGAKIKALEEDKAQLKKLSEVDLKCMICLELIKNPQVLQCGHTACYPCLRTWWTRPNTEPDGAEIVSTDDEEEPEPLPINPAPGPRPRLRHRFSSTVNRQKNCPYCQAVITQRPALDYRVRDVLDTMNNRLLSASNVNRRQDMWHGIFHPEPDIPLPVQLDALRNRIAGLEQERVTTSQCFEYSIYRAYEAGRRRAFMEAQGNIGGTGTVAFNGTVSYQGQGPQGFIAPPYASVNNPVPPPPHQGGPAVAPRQGAGTSQAPVAGAVIMPGAFVNNPAPPLPHQGAPAVTLRQGAGTPQAPVAGGATMPGAFVNNPAPFPPHQGAHNPQATVAGAIAIQNLTANHPPPPPPPHQDAPAIAPRQGAGTPQAPVAVIVPGAFVNNPPPPPPHQGVPAVAPRQGAVAIQNLTANYPPPPPPPSPPQGTPRAAVTGAIAVQNPAVNRPAPPPRQGAPAIAFLPAPPHELYGPGAGDSAGM